MADMAKSEIAALVDVARGDQPQVDLAQHVDQPAACGLGDVAYRRLGKFGIAGRVEKERLVQEQRHRLAIDVSEPRGQPVELLGLAVEPGVPDQRIEAGKAPTGFVDVPAGLADDWTKKLHPVLPR